MVIAIKSSIPFWDRSKKLNLTNSTKAIAPMVGMAKRKLNLEAAVALSPKNRPAVIVMPDLEVPGMSAKH